MFAGERIFKIGKYLVKLQAIGWFTCLGRRNRRLHKKWGRSV